MTSRASRCAICTLLTGALAQNKGRNLLSVLAIALGVALGYAVQLINQAAVDELLHGVQTLSGEADLEIRGPADGFDEAVYPDIARLTEVAAANPVVEVDAALVDRKASLKIVGIDVFRAQSITPLLLAEPKDRLDLLRPDTIFLSGAAARAVGVEVGATLRLQTGLRESRLRVAGFLKGGVGQQVAVMDIAGVQSHFHRLGRLTRIDLRLKAGTDVESLRERVQRQLPAGVVVDRPQATLTANASLSRSYRANLNVLSLVALFTGGLLIFSTQSLSVLRRGAQYALLRALGMTRRRLRLLVIVEGGAVGVVGALLGLACGFALAQAALNGFGGDLGSGYFRGVIPVLSLEPRAMAAFLALGVATAIAGSVVPARVATRAQVASALKAEASVATTVVHSPWPGAMTIVAGALLAFAPPVAQLPIFGYAAVALLLVGALMLLPRMAQVVFAATPLSIHWGVPSRLGLAQLKHSPAQTSVSLAAIFASVSLVVSMAIMVTSFRQSLERWLEQILPADLYVRANADGNTGYITPAEAEEIARTPGIRRIEWIREQQLLLDPSRPRVVLIARAIDAAHAGNTLPLLKTVSVGQDASPAWVNEAAADLYGFTLGQSIELPIAGARARFTVAGVWRDYARSQGAIVIPRERYIALTGDASATNAALWLDPGADSARTAAAIENERTIGVDRALQVASPGELRTLSLKLFDRTFAVTYALESAAVLLGLIGLSSSFAALVFARRREFGMLRHIGMTKRQVVAMLATEGALQSFVGLVAGLVMGAVISLVLVFVVNRQSFHWSMDLFVPWAGLSSFALAMLALSTLAALISGRQAMADDMVQAIKDDW